MNLGPRPMLCKFLLMIGASLFVAPMAVARDADYERLVHLYDYDDKLLVDSMVTKSARDVSGVTIQDITYASPKGGRVPAYIVFPQRTGRYPAVIFLHWGGGNRTTHLPEAVELARSGCVSLLVEAPFARPAEWRHNYDFEHPENDRDWYVQTVVDVRRGIDLLSGRGNVDPSRIAFVGHSFGGHIGGILVGVDRRVSSAVMVAAVPQFTKLIEESPEPDLAAVRAGLGDRKLKRYLETLAPLDAISYVGRSQVPMLFQFGRYDTNVPETVVKAYYDAAKGPKEIRGYLCGHEMNDPAAVRDRATWLASRLGFTLAK